MSEERRQEPAAETGADRGGEANPLHGLSERLNAAIAQTSDGLWDYAVRSDRVWFSARFWSLLGYGPDEQPASGTRADWQRHMHPDDLERVVEVLKAHLYEGGPYDVEYRMRCKSGAYRWFRARATTRRDASGMPLHMTGSVQDIHDHKTAQVREAAQARTMSLIASGAPLKAVLESIVLGVEEEHPAMICSVLLMDKAGKRLQQGAAPSLPSFYNAAVHGLAIGENVGSCGTAAFSGRRVIVEDIMSDPKWTGFRELAARAGLQSCWSEPIVGTDGQVLGTFAIYHRDVHSPTEANIELITASAQLARFAIERKQAEESLRWRTAFFEAQADCSTDAILVVDSEGHWIHHNRQMEVMWQIPPEMAGNTNDRAQLRHVLKLHKDPKGFMRRVNHLYAHPDEVGQDEIELVDGRVLERFSAPVHDRQRQYYGRIWRFRDITARRQMERALREAARVDKLTGLANRSMLMERLQAAVERHRAPGASGQGYAVLFLDFDRFKMVNDHLGHDVGDQLLQEIARRLTAVVDAAEPRSPEGNRMRSFASRLGGDEFVILLKGERLMREAERVAQAVLAALARPFKLDKLEVTSTASVGIVTSECPYERAEDVLRDADTAMYEAKSAGRGRAAKFDESMRTRLRRRMDIENGLRRAIEAGSFEIHYQPIVSLENGWTQGLEALVRWRHPEIGPVSPGEFIPVAEEAGLIVALGDWVFRHVCRQMAGWRRALGEAWAPSVSINLSRAQLSMPDLARRLTVAAAEEGVRPEWIHLEITEGAIMSDAIRSVEVLREIKSAGFRVHIDDFGTGYSSLANLHEFPIDVLKIDQSFIAHMSRGREFAALVSAIITLARNLNILVIAEGVETEEQVSMLQLMDCHLAQGFHFARPMPGAAVARWLAERGQQSGRREVA